MSIRHSLFVLFLLITVLVLSTMRPPDVAAQETAPEAMGPDLEHVSGVVFPSGVPFSEAVRIGDVLYLSGSIGTEPDTEKRGTAEMVPGGIKAEARQAMEHIRTYLEAAGSSMDRIARCTVFMVDLDEWAAFNEVYTSFFEPPYPARSAVGVKELVLDARVEIECIAAAGLGSGV
jgi:reactive intermediate/imine deaminase